ncbi:MAG TPA: response regulator [Phycisphaerales bacterium]
MNTSNATADTVHPARPISVLCVDDNRHLAEALRIAFEHAGFVWRGWLPGAEVLAATVRKEGPAVVILDIDMPGRSPFDALEELVEVCPDCRAVVFSGHVRHDLIDRAFAAGAWGYVSKSDGEVALMQAVREVCRNEIATSPEVRYAYEKGA